MIPAAIALFGRFCIFSLLACAGFGWLWAAQLLAGDLARERQAWQGATLLILAAVGLGLLALAFWPVDPVPLPNVTWHQAVQR